MSQSGSQTDRDRAQQALIGTLATVAGTVGCLTLVIILGALVLGLLLDKLLDTRPLFTILLLVGSMPLTWVVIFKVVNRSKQRILDLNPSSSAKKPVDWEEAESDRD
jgi:F0F1-type ATP synthase assembly protein I